MTSTSTWTSSVAALLVLAAAAAALGAAAGGEALRALYRSCAGKVMAVALRILRDRGEAEDVVQETFLELWRRGAEYDARRASPSTWAVVIARSRAIDRLRARASAARAAAARDAPEELAPPAAEPVERREERERVLGALAELPSEQREALELAFHDGLSHREIAARTGQPLGTVKTRLRLAMEKLQARLVAREDAA
jgi:RNA polymerase sigma-70 factor (ECF subfamily)